MHKLALRFGSRRLLLPTAFLMVVGFVTAFTWKDENEYYFKVNKNLELFGAVYREVSQSYVDRIEPDTFVTAGLDAMLRTLDPYTVYQRGDASDVDLLTTGSYGGIGITVGMRGGGVTVIDVIDGYSAQQEGVRIGDRLQAINGVDVRRGSIESLRELTRGTTGTSLTVTVMREGAAKPITFRLMRENVKLRSVAFAKMLPDGVGYIRLERFSAAAGDEVRTALGDLRKAGGLQGLILDLRDNPGGLLDAAVDVASNFVPPGSVIVSTRGRDTAENRVYRSKEPPIALDLPLVVLINGNSASAAEIVAGAVQDLDAGVIMGTQSYGKGLVQTVRRLPYDASLKITTARYYTPLGRSIQKVEYGHASSDAGARSSVGFRTAHGRVMREHGGITPDTVAAEVSLPGLLAQLRDASIFFKFATRYAASMQRLPANFAVSDDLLGRFQEFALAAEQLALIDSSSAGTADRLRAAAVREGLSADVLARLDAVRDALTAERRRFLAQHGELVRTELYNEILARFQGQRERRNAQVETDAQVRGALALLHTGRAAYTRLLSMK